MARVKDLPGAVHRTSLIIDTHLSLRSSNPQSRIIQSSDQRDHSRNKSLLSRVLPDRKGRSLHSALDVVLVLVTSQIFPILVDFEDQTFLFVFYIQVLHPIYVSFSSLEYYLLNFQQEFLALSKPLLILEGKVYSLSFL